jgi:hypothetical protein
MIINESPIQIIVLGVSIVSFKISHVNIGNTSHDVPKPMNRELHALSLRAWYVNFVPIYAKHVIGRASINAIINDLSFQPSINCKLEANQTDTCISVKNVTPIASCSYILRSLSRKFL